MWLGYDAIGLDAVVEVIRYCASHKSKMMALLKRSIQRYHSICERKSSSLDEQVSKWSSVVVRIMQDLEGGGNDGPLRCVDKLG